MKVINISRNYLKENVIFLAKNNIRDQIMNFSEKIISCSECKKQTVLKKEMILLFTQVLNIFLFVFKT